MDFSDPQSDKVIIKAYVFLHTYGDRAFSVAAPKLWNELPLDHRSLNTINLFKKHLKTDLFKKVFNV